MMKANGLIWDLLYLSLFRKLKQGCLSRLRARELDYPGVDLFPRIQRITQDVKIGY